MKKHAVIILVAFGVSISLSVFAQPLSAQSSEAQEIPLWPEGAPGALGTDEDDVPTLTIRLASPDKANGAAVVICPGGGYWGLAMDHEGRQVADWLNEAGVLAERSRCERIHPQVSPCAEVQTPASASRRSTCRANGKSPGDRMERRSQSNRNSWFLRRRASCVHSRDTFR